MKDVRTSDGFYSRFSRAVRHHRWYVPRSGCLALCKACHHKILPVVALMGSGRIWTGMSTDPGVCGGALNAPSIADRESVALQAEQAVHVSHAWKIEHRTARCTRCHATVRATIATGFSPRSPRSGLLLGLQADTKATAACVPLPPKEITPRAPTAPVDYAKLVVDLKAAVGAAQVAAEAWAHGDGGSANRDCPFLKIPGARKVRVEAALAAAGVRGSRISSSLWRGWMLYLPSHGQGDLRAVATKAAADLLRERGWNACVFYKLD
jgi:hypothetical protein